MGMTIGALMVARNSPAVAYEASMYTATPSIVWIVLFINLVCGISIVVHQVGSKRIIEQGFTYEHMINGFRRPVDSVKQGYD